MAAASRKANDLKAKEKRQKQILLGASAVLAVLLAIQVPKLMHRSSAAAPAPVAAAPTAAPAAAATLVDTDVPATPSDGQLVQFDLFDAKDPFVQQVQDATAATAATPASSAGPNAATPAKKPEEPAATFATVPPPQGEKTKVARILVGDRPQDVLADGTFPAASPAFRLVSFSAAKAKIEVVGGSFQSGAPTLTLEKGTVLTLENTADGTRFALLYKGPRTVATASLAEQDG
jgi:hypothetical protein